MFISCVSVWSSDAVDYVDPWRFRREAGEGCEKPAENQLQSDLPSSVSKPRPPVTCD